MIQKFEFHSTLIPGLMEIIPFKADDLRGSFVKDYSKEVFEKMEFFTTYRKFFTPLVIEV